MIIQKRTMAWLPKASMYQEAEAARLKRKSSHQTFLNTQSAFASAFGDVRAAEMTGTTDLISQIAVARIKKTA